MPSSGLRYGEKGPTTSDVSCETGKRRPSLCYLTGTSPFFGESPRSGESLGTESPEKRGFANTRCLKPPMFPHFSKFCWYPPVSSNVAIGKSLVKMEAFNRTPTGKSSIHGWIFDDHPTSLAFHFLCPANSSPVARPISSRHPSAPLLQ